MLGRITAENLDCPRDRAVLGSDRLHTYGHRNSSPWLVQENYLGLVRSAVFDAGAERAAIMAEILAG